MLSALSTASVTSWSAIGVLFVILTRVQLAPASLLTATHGSPQWPFGRKMRPVVSAARCPVRPPHTVPALGSAPVKAGIVVANVSPPLMLRLQLESPTWL